MLLILAKILIYAAIAFLAYACILTANTMNKDSCKCDRHGMALVILGCATFFLSVFYNLTREYVLIALVPLVAGISLWLVVSDSTAHDRFDKLATDIKVRAILALELIKRR